GLAYSIGWALDPVMFGDYPLEMREILGNQLPNFTKAEIEFMKDSVDYIAVNHYSTRYAKDCIHSSCSLTEIRPINGFVDEVTEQNGVQIGAPTGVAVFPVVPRGFGEVIDYLKKRYNNKPMFVTENGMQMFDKFFWVQTQSHMTRIQFHKNYLSSLAQAIRNGANVEGYFVWTLLDDFEWIDGKTPTVRLEPKTSRVVQNLLRREKVPAISSSQDANSWLCAEGVFGYSV
nr:beta-glucosidase 18-like [Tanacetum cinerariifolium]